MSWLNLAIGLIREAATTEIGQDIIADMRSGSSKKPHIAKSAQGARDPADEWKRSVDERLKVSDRNTELLVRMLNTQDEALILIQKRQRIWNLALATVVLLTALAVLWFRFA